MREVLIGDDELELSPLVVITMVFLAAMMSTGLLFAILITTVRAS